MRLTSIARYHIKLALQGLALMIPVSTLLFLTWYLSPGDPVNPEPSMWRFFLIIWSGYAVVIGLPVSIAYWRAVRRARSASILPQAEI